MFQDKLKELRNAKNLTQVDLAKQINQKFDLKIDRSMISKWETGFQVPVTYTIKCLAQFFGVSMDYLNDNEETTKKSGKGVKIPVLGVVRAGIPIEAEENIIDYEEISQSMAATGEFFALQIKGDSMEPRITEGDVVIVRKQSSVDNGEIAVVLVNGNEATVKKFYKTDNGIKLISTNAKYDPFFFTPAEVNSLPVAVIGKVVELRAKF